MTDKYFNKVREVLEPMGFEVMINKAGNVKVKRPDQVDFFVLYESETTNNKPLWRRFIGYSGYCYPLHMVGRKDVRHYYDDNEFYVSKEGHNMDNYAFNNIDEALVYFVTYLNKFYNKRPHMTEPYKYRPWN